MMAEMLLRDQEIFPTNDVLKAILGDSFAAYQEFGKLLSDQGIVPEWNYYRDGHAWLCKLLLKKKNLGWLHVYDGYFMVSFFFMEKHFEKIAALDISESVKKAFFDVKPTGKLIPMFITVDSRELPDDLMKVLLFKKGLK